jgi:hypothetical protein
MLALRIGRAVMFFVITILRISDRYNFVVLSQRVVIGHKSVRCDVQAFGACAASGLSHIQNTCFEKKLPYI